MWCAARTCSGRPACIACCSRCSICRCRTITITGWCWIAKAASSPNRRRPPGCASYGRRVQRLRISASLSDLPHSRGLMAKARRQKTAKKRSAAPRWRASRRRRSATEVALASLAHEIRTPLTSILALAELLYASDLPEREQRWAEAIRDAADHLARLTELVVDAAKPDAARLEPRAES